jgi:hypothetical protein
MGFHLMLWVGLVATRQQKGFCMVLEKEPNVCAL